MTRNDTHKNRIGRKSDNTESPADLLYSGNVAGRSYANASINICADITRKNIVNGYTVE